MYKVDTYNGRYAIKPNQTNHIYLIYMYKEDLALKNLLWLICHKIQPNPTKPNQTKPNQSNWKFTVKTDFEN